MKRLTAYFFKFLAYLLWLMPTWMRESLGHFIGFLWFDVLRIRRQVAIENVGIAFPDSSLQERTRIARASLHHMGLMITEYALFPFFDDQEVKRTFIFEGLENMNKALEEKKGVIMLTLHVGNGDFATAALSRIGLQVNLISKEFKQRTLNELWFGMRKRHGTQFIRPEKSSFEILRALKRKEIVIFVLDQFMGPPVGVRTRFFGRETGTAAGCALMASRTGAPVVPTHTYRRPDGRHVVVFEPALEASAGVPELSQDLSRDGDLREKNIAVMTQLYTDKIESIVRRHPEQWMWIHRRWKEFRD